MIRYHLLMALLAFLASSTFGQMVTIKERPSFYLGKRFSLNIGVGVQPTLSPTKPKPDDKEYIDRLLPVFPNVKTELNFSFALNNTVALYAKGALASTSRLSSYIHSSNQNGQDVSGEELGMPRMKGVSMGGGISIFKNSKGALAPIGNHFSIGIIKQRFNVTYEDMYVGYRDYNNSSLYDLGEIKSSVTYYSLEMSINSNQPITRSLYYQIGLSSSINFKKTISNTENPGLENLEFELGINNLEGLAFRDIAVFKLGLGYVL